ncbi:MAG: hypothetical protein JSW43_03605 [Gemmatimonadota bacterium]|nr:MAG: hypothetical protein JSW43_03605 [Gemmatimonadota bacterium]
MTDAVAKGVNFVFAKEYILKEHGEDVWRRALSRLPLEQAAIWTGALVPFGGYSFPAFKAMTHAVAEETGQRDDRELARMYEYIADRSLNAVYKIFIKLAHPSFVIGNYPKLWSRFFTTGSVTVPAADKGFAKVHFELPEMFLDWLRPACLGYSNKAVSMSGGRDVLVEERSRKLMPSGDWAVDFEIRWSE